MKLLKILTLIMLLLFSAGAAAHSKLIATTPANEATINESPEQLTLEFNREVRLLKVELIQDDEDAVDIDFKPVMEKGTTFAVNLPELEAANYLVTWIAMGGDSHKMKGEFSFVLAAADEAEAGTDENPGASDDSGEASSEDTSGNVPEKIDHRDAASVANGFNMALSRSNPQLLEVIAAPEVIIYEEGGIEQSFEEYSAGHLKSDIAFMSKVNRTVKSQQVIEDGKLATVITHSEIHNKAAHASSNIHRSMLETMVLKQAANDWKIVHIHWSSQKI